MALRSRFGLLQTKVGRRVVLLFVGCAMVPITILGVTTYHGVGEQLREQAESRAREASKRVGMSLHERLDFLSAALVTASTADEWDDVDSRLGALVMAGPAGARAIRGAIDLPLLDSAQLAHLARGQTLAIVAERDGAPRLILAHAAGGSGRILWAMPPANMLPALLSVEENEALDIRVCVFQRRSEPVHCADAAGLGATLAQGSDPSGVFEWTGGDGERYLAGYWSLFLAHRYGAGDWLVVYSESARTVYAPLTRFRQTFPAAGVLALLVVALLSNVELRRSLRPLRAFRQATERLAQRDFSQVVEVHSGDEFEDLAEAFNGMSVRLREQFESAEVLTVALREASDNVSEREARLRAVLESAADGIIVVAEGGRIESLNTPAQRLLGVTDGTGLDFLGLTGVQLDEAGYGSGSAMFQASVRRADGTTFPADIAVGVARAGKHAFQTVFVRDISERLSAGQERELLEAQLRQAQKMETIGTLAGGIAHDFNNILTPIMMTLEMVLADEVMDKRLRGDLEQVSGAAQRARDLVKQILTFSRRTEQTLIPVSPEPVVTEAIKFLRSSLPATIEMRSHVSADVPQIMGDGTQLHQVIMNLCTNSWHAMRETGGVLEVRLETVDVDPVMAAGQPRLAGGRAVKLTIRDTGCGMDRTTLERLYEPFFTTKGPGEGTGLGMSITHGIITGLGGAIVVDSAPGKGTRFELYLPALQASGIAVASVVREIRNGEGRVLVVDDDSAIATLTSRLLKRSGFEVLTYTSPLEALKAVTADPACCDVVITDHTMPGMTGTTLAARLREVRPDLPLILMSGYAEPPQDGAVGPDLFAAVLVKPVDIRSLTSAVSRVLKAQSRITGDVQEVAA